MLRDAADPLAIGGHHSRTILPSNLLHSCSHLPHDMGISRGIELEALSFVSPSNSLLFSSKAAWKITAQNKASCQEGWGKSTVPTVMVAAVTLCPAGGGRAAHLALFPIKLAQPSPRHGPRDFPTVGKLASHPWVSQRDVGTDGRAWGSQKGVRPRATSAGVWQLDGKEKFWVWC